MHTTVPEDGDFVIETVTMGSNACCQVLIASGTCLWEFDGSGEYHIYDVDTDDNVYGSSHEKILLVTDEFGLYRLDILNTEKEPILLWGEQGITFSHIDDILQISEEKFLVIDNGQAYMLEGTENTGTAEIKTVSIAVLSPAYDWGYIVNQFNQSCAEYNVKIEDYYEKSGSIEDAIKLLNTQLISGTGPDIIYFGGFSSQPYSGHGFLTDLYTFMDNDPGLSRENFIGLGCMESNGGLYTISPGFYIDTFLGLESVFGERYSWSLDEYFDRPPGRYVRWGCRPCRCL